MKRNLRHAFNAMKKIGAPVYDHDEQDYYVLSAEENYDDMWADYHEGYRFFNNRHEVNDKLAAILDNHKCWCEWQNAGCLHVYSEWSA